MGQHPAAPKLRRGELEGVMEGQSGVVCVKVARSGRPRDHSLAVLRVVPARIPAEIVTLIQMTFVPVADDSGIAASHRVAAH